MSQEWVLVAGSVISACAVLAGSFLTWLLGSITSSEASRRQERVAIRQSTEDRYLAVMTSIELFIRSKTRGAEVDKELAAANAVISLFSNQQVKDSFISFCKNFLDYQLAYEASGKVYVSIPDAADDYPKEWGKAIKAMLELSAEMSRHIKQLHSQKG